MPPSARASAAPEAEAGGGEGFPRETRHIRSGIENNDQLDPMPTDVVRCALPGAKEKIGEPPSRRDQSTPQRSEPAKSRNPILWDWDS